MKLVSGLLGTLMKKSFISAGENLKENSRIVNYTCYMHFNLKAQKKRFLIKKMTFQNLLRKKLKPQGNSNSNGIY